MNSIIIIILSYIKKLCMVHLMHHQLEHLKSSMDFHYLQILLKEDHLLLTLIQIIQPIFLYHLDFFLIILIFYLHNLFIYYISLFHLQIIYFYFPNLIYNDTDKYFIYAYYVSFIGYSSISLSINYINILSAISSNYGFYSNYLNVS